MKWAGSVFLLLIIFLPAQAQDNLIIQGEYAKGFILQHSPAISHLVVSHPSSYFISAYKATSGEKDWESRYNFPKIGATLFLVDYHNNVLGKTISIIPNFNFLIGDHSEKLNGYFKIGLGPSYHTNPYDKVENNKNNVTSTHLSYGIIFQSGIDVKLSDRIDFNAGLSFTHFSNGSVKKPNKGINVVSINTGISYALKVRDQLYLHDTTNFNKRYKWQPTAVLTTGYSETIKIRSGSFPFFNFQLSMDKQVNFKSRIGIGVEYFHSLSLKEEIKNDHHLQDQDRPDFKRAAIFLSHELVFDNLSVLKQAGWYVYRPYEVFEPFYVRLGLRYNVSERIFVGLAVKSHYFKAEAAEWSIGYRF